MRVRSHLCPWYARPLGLELLVATSLLCIAVLWDVWRPVGLQRLLEWSPWSLPLGILAAIPPLLIIVLLELPASRRCSWGRQAHESLTAVLVPWLRHVHWREILALACLAGLSEEVFFRGVLQQELGLILTAFIFGALHAINIPYMLWAALVGLYLGWLTLLAHNLWLPIVVHTVVDGLGLCYIRFVVVPRYAVLNAVWGTNKGAQG